MKGFADDNIEFDENGNKFSKGVENTVGKGEIACYKKCLHFSQYFKKTYTADTLTPGLVWEKIKTYKNLLRSELPWTNNNPLQDLFNPLPDDKF